MEGDSLSLRVYPADAPLLPEFVRTRLERGIPVTVGRQVELRRERRGWVDRTAAKVVERFRVRRDPWAGTYTASDGDRAFSADSLGTVERWLLQTPVVIPLDRTCCGSGDVYWVDLTLAVLPLTTEDLGEVEHWISGEIGDDSSSLLSIPKGFFGFVRDVTGLGDRRSRSRSGPFALSIIASDWTWVRPLSEANGEEP